MLSWGGALELRGWLGPLAVTGGCLAWALGNNLTRKVLGGDPVQVACLKGGIASAVNLLSAVAIGAKLPPPMTIVRAGSVGFLSYGVSLAFFVLSPRHLGTARTGAHPSTAPFIGAVLCSVMLGDPLTLPSAIATHMMNTPQARSSLGRAERWPSRAWTPARSSPQCTAALPGSVPRTCPLTCGTRRKRQPQSPAGACGRWQSKAASLGLGITRHIAQAPGAARGWEPSLLHIGYPRSHGMR